MLLLLAALLIFAGSGQAADASQHFEQAARAAAGGDLTSAIQQYEAGLLLKPDSPAAWNNLGAAYFSKGEEAKAAECFEKAVRLQEGNTEFQFNLGLAQFRAGKLESALDHFGKATRSGPNASTAHYLAGLCHYYRKQWDLAVGEFTLAQKDPAIGPQNAYFLIKACRYASRKTEGMRAFAALANAHPDSEFVHELLGEALEATGQTDAAEKEMREAVARSPDAPELNFALGYFYWKQKRFAEAKPAFLTELKRNPQSVGSLYYLGDIALKEGEPQRALTYFQQAHTAEPSWSKADLGLGRAELQLTQFTEAESALRRFVAANPQSSEAHYWLARTLLACGKTTAGAAEMQIYRSLHEKEQAQAQETFQQASSVR